MKKIIALPLVFFVVLASAQIPSYLPTSGLVGYWPFSGNANDQSGNGNNGIVYGAIPTADRFGNPNSAYLFDGSSSYISVENSTSLQLSQFTLSAWVNTPIDTMNIQQEIILKDEYPYNYGMNLNGNHKTAGFFNTNGNYIQTVSPDTLESTIWHNIVFTHNGTTASLYADGVKVSEVTGTNILTNTGKLYFGKWSGNNYFFKGKIDDIGIWNRALSSSEINNVYLSYGNVGINTTNPQRNLHVNNTLRLEPRFSTPDNPVEGDIYYDGNFHKLRVYDGTTWQNAW